MQSNTTPATTTQATTTQATTTQATTTQTPDYDFENDDDAFYDFIDFGIASNGGRLSMK
jgi:hypothetical protein